MKNFKVTLKHERNEKGMEIYRLENRFDYFDEIDWDFTDDYIFATVESGSRWNRDLINNGFEVK